MANIINKAGIAIGVGILLGAGLMTLTGVISPSNMGFLSARTLNPGNDAESRNASKTQPNSQPSYIATSNPQKNSAARIPVGINLAGVTDWTTAWPFVDAFKISRPWVAQREGARWGEGEPLNLTPDGWVASLKPGQYAETVMFSNRNNPVGRYTILYDGQGRLALSRGRNTPAVIDQAPGRMVIDVKAEQSIFLQLRETNPANPIRNIRVILPGFEATYQKQPFHPLFLERLAKFKVLRFMDWMETNNSEVQEWSDRATLKSATQAGDNGVALEYMIQLANTLKVDPWFTMPHQASDDYVRKFATMVRDRLDPSRKIYIEYTNETWNNQFKQARYATRKGQELGLSENAFQARLRYYSQRSVEMFKIWREVFGGSDRIVEVMASQGANPWTGEQVLGWKDAARYTEQYAIAPYIHGNDLNNPKNVDQTLRLSQDQIIDNLFDYTRNRMREGIIKNRELAKKYGVGLITYEGGPHLTSGQMPRDKEPQVTKLFTAVNRHPRMRELYVEYLNQWQTLGGGLFMQFTSVGGYGKWGSWGMLEHQNQDLKTAPKYQGLMDFINGNAKSTQSTNKR